MAIQALNIPTTQRRSGIGRFFLGRSPEALQYDTMTPDQIAARQQFLQQGMQTINNPYEGFEPIANLAYRNFNQQVIPSIMERFSALGSGAQRSNAFAQTLGGAGSDLEAQLAAQRAMYGMENKRFGQSLAGMGMQNQFNTSFIPEEQGFLKAFANQLPELGTRLGTAYMTSGMSEFGRLANNMANQNAPAQGPVNTPVGYQVPNYMQSVTPQNLNRSIIQGRLNPYYM